MTRNHLYNWFIDYQSAFWDNFLMIFLVVSNMLRKYLKRELSILELDDAEYYRFKEGVKDPRYMYTIIDQELRFNYLSKTPIQVFG